MIRWQSVLHVSGLFLLALSAGIALVTLFAFVGGDSGLSSLLISCGISVGLGSALYFGFRRVGGEFSGREGVLLVTLTWLLAGIMGALPYLFSGFVPSVTDAFFESISGFTTTGATILRDVEALPQSLLLWRSLTQWIGGMGIIVLVIAILPLIGTGGMELYRAEFSGAKSEKLSPRVAETAVALWKLYVSFTVLEIVALAVAGMSWFEALCHSFTTMATGGFSTRNLSVEAFSNPAVEYIIILFMLIAGVNFTQHYRLFVERRPRKCFSDQEVQAYFLLVLISTVLVTVSLSWSSAFSEKAVRGALFQVVSIFTTTGFSSLNFELWGPFSQLILLALMFVGGSTGSTAGGLKVARLFLLFRVVGREFRRLVERRGVFAVKFNGEAVSETSIQSLLNLVYIAFLMNFSASMALTAMGVDVLTAISAVAASMFNIGPGLGNVGPAHNYAHLAPMAKWVLSFCMLAGRLEFYTLLILFTRVFWRK